MSGLPHAVVKHPYRETFQADLQQNNAYNPFSDESKAMIREMGNVGLFELCETINSKSAMLRMRSLLESRSDLLWTSLVLKANPDKFLVNGDWVAALHSALRH